MSQQSDNGEGEAVLESGSMRFQTFVSFARQERGEDRITGL